MVLLSQKMEKIVLFIFLRFRGEGFKTLNEGQSVEFEKSMGQERPASLEGNT